MDDKVLELVSEYLRRSDMAINSCLKHIACADNDLRWSQRLREFRSEVLGFRTALLLLGYERLAAEVSKWLNKIYD